MSFNENVTMRQNLKFGFGVYCSAAKRKFVQFLVEIREWSFKLYLRIWKVKVIIDIQMIVIRANC